MFLRTKASWLFLTIIIGLIILVCPQVSTAQNRVTKLADLNGDGISDLIWGNPSNGQSVSWLMNGTNTSTTAALPNEAGWTIAAAADFNGDGTTDLIWRDPSSGQIIEWLMNGVSINSSTLLLNDPLWNVAEAADLNGDGMSDLVMHNASTGQTVAWLMNGPTIASWALLRTDPIWEVIASNDFNADGMSDLVWFNSATGETALWLMNGAITLSSATIGTDPSWSVQATADFNLDKMADILWYKAATGETTLWLMNGTASIVRTSLQTNLNLRVAATGDLNGDGKADLLWHNNSTGQSEAWLMDGTTVQTSAPLQSDLNWKVQATADLNGDKKSDILWYNTGTGQTALWLMDGTVGIGGTNLFTDPVWKLQCIKVSSLTSALACDPNLASTSSAIAPVPPNQAPVVNAGTDQTITFPEPAILSAILVDDRLPIGLVTASWSVVSGPGTVVFSNRTQLATTASFSAAGTYTLRLTATDSQLSSSNTIIVVVGGPSNSNAGKKKNLAPIVDAGPDQTITLPAPADLAGSAADDGLPYKVLTASWRKVNGPGTVIFGNPDSMTTTATLSAPGSYTLRLSVTDGSLSRNDDVVIVAEVPSAANKAPVVNAGGDQMITLPASANLAGVVTDDGLPSGSTLSMQWIYLSGGGTVTFGNAGSKNTTATFSAAGTYTLRLTATDGKASTFDDVIISVSSSASTNKAPVVNAGADQTIALPSGAVLSGTATDDGLPASSSLSFSWSKVSGPGTVVFVSVNSLNASAAIQTAGTYTLRLTASDGTLSSSDDLVITVNPAPTNRAPVVNAGADQSTTVTAAANLVGTVTDDGLPSGGVVAKSWTTVNGPGAVAFGNAAAASTPATFSTAGTYTLRLTASDSSLSAADDVVVTVNAPVAVNLAPVVNAGSDATVTLPNGIALAGSATDDGLPTGSTLTRYWSRVSGPSTVTFGDASALNTQAAFPAPGTYTVRLTVSDGSLSSFDDVVIVVNAAVVNLAPVVNAGPDYTFTLPNGITLAGTATDDGLPSGSTLAKSWSKVSGPGTVTFGNAASLNSTANFSAAGTYTLRLTASDSLLSTSDDVVFVVNAAAVNQAPVVNAGPDYSFTLPNGITLAGTASDDGLPTGSTLTKSWSKISGPGTVTFGNASLLNSTASFSAAGTYTLRLTVSDSLLSTSDDVVFVVSSSLAANLAPVVNAGSDQTITFPGMATLAATATDDGFPSGTLTSTWSKVSGPGTVTFANASSLTTSATFSVVGTYTLRLSTTDGALNSSDDVVIVVTPCGTLVSGTKTIGANATDNVGVVSVQMKLDGVNLGSSIVLTPYALVWDTRSIPNGCHQITVVAQDAAGNQGTASLTTLVNNP